MRPRVIRYLARCFKQLLEGAPPAKALGLAEADPRATAIVIDRTRRLTKRRRGPKPNEEIELQVMAAFLRAGMKTNKIISGKRFKVAPDEEPPARGTQRELARLHGLSDAAVSKIIKKWRRDPSLLLRAQIAAMSGG